MTALAGTDPETRPRRHAVLLVWFLSLSGLAFAVLQSLVVPAISVINRDLHVSTGDGSWVITTYLLASSVLTPVLGRLGDVAGKRRVLVAVLTVMAAGTLLAALAPNLAVLIVARALQGAAGAIMPLSIGLVRDGMRPDRIGVTVGLLSAINGVGAGVGIVAAGPIVAHLSWRWLFWLPLLLIVIALLGAVFGMTDAPGRSPGRLDVAGSALLAVALGSLLTAVGKGQDWGWDAATVGLLGLGVAALAAFLLVESRVPEPLVDLRLIRIRAVWASHLVALILGFAMFGTFLLVPMLVQLPAETGYGFGRPVSQAGLFLLPTVLMMVLCGPVAGILTRRSGPRLPMVTGAAAVVAAFLLLAVDHGALWQLLLAGLLTGAGIGLAFGAMPSAIIAGVPATQTGVATGVNSIARTIGGSISTAVVAGILTAGTTADGRPTDDAFTAVFWLCAAVALLGLLAALALPPARHREADPPVSLRVPIGGG